MLGRHLCYHYTTIACIASVNRRLLEVSGHYPAPPIGFTSICAPTRIALEPVCPTGVAFTGATYKGGAYHNAHERKEHRRHPASIFWHSLFRWRILLCTAPFIFWDNALNSLFLPPNNQYCTQKSLPSVEAHQVLAVFLLSHTLQSHSEKARTTQT